MKLLKLLLDISLIFIYINGVAGFAQSQKFPIQICRMNIQTIKLMGYDIKLTPYINTDVKNRNIYTKFKSYIDEQGAKGNFIFYAESTMSFKCIDKIYSMCLHAKNLEIDETAIKIVYTPDIFDPFNIVTKVPKINSYGNIPENVNLDFDDALLPQNYTYRLIIKFVGSITDITDIAGDFIKTSYRNKGKQEWLIAAADFRGTGARQIFPCWDEPDVRTKFNISVKHHKNYTALSNSPIDQVIIDGNKVWTHFKTTDDISAYHVAIILCTLDNFPITNMWHRKDVEQETIFSHIVAINATSYLKRLLYSANFPSKVNHVIIPGFQDKGLESWGLVLYRESAVIYNEEFDPFGKKFEVARMVARKMAHQLFSNLVSPTWWSHLWLNEGIATFLAMKIVKQCVHSRLMDLLAMQYQHESFRLNDYYDMPLTEQMFKVFTPSDINNSLLSFTYYVKAPVFVRTLFEIISPFAFDIGLNEYLSMYQLRSVDRVNTTTDAFLDALHKAQENLHPLNVNLITIMDKWTTEERYPVLKVTRESSGNNIKITSKRNYDPQYPMNLWIPVTFTTQNAPNITEKRWLSPHEPIIQLEDINKNDWIIVNVEQIGYYRVNYDEDNWLKLKEYLISAEYLNIHVLNRAQIIDDAYYFLSMNNLDFYVFQSLMYYLSKETNYVAWYPMFKIMEYVSSFFPFSQSLEIKEYFRIILDSVLSKIDYPFLTDRSREDAFIECLRQEAAKWACIVDSYFCEFNAHLMLEQRYKQPLFSILPDILEYPGWKQWTYCKGLMIANCTLWNSLFQKYHLKSDNQLVSDNKLLEHLACSKNHTIILHYLMKSGNFTEARDRITVFHSIIARHAKNDFVLNYIIHNLAVVVPSEIKTIVALTDIINHLYSENQLNKLKDFVENKFPLEIFSYVKNKTEKRLFEINKQIDYFDTFLTTK